MDDWAEKEEERRAAMASTASGQAAGAGGHEDEGPQFVAYVPLPEQAAIEQLVLEKKKLDLLAKYTSDSLAAQQQEAKSLLNKQ